MAVTSSELILYATTNIPTDDSGTLGGAIDEANQINDGEFAKIVGTVYANPLAGADKIFYGKAHVKNSNAVDNLADAIIYGENILTNPTGTAVMSITTVAAADDNTKKVRIKGRNSTGTPTQEDVTLPATPGTVFSTTQWLTTFPLVVELRDVASPYSLVAAAGDIDLSVNSASIGKIPAGCKSATGRIKIGLASSLDDTATATNRITAPAGITFSSANSVSTALDVANSGTLTHDTDQAVWFEYTLNDGDIETEDMQVSLVCSNES